MTSAVRRFYGWLVREGKLKRNPMEWFRVRGELGTLPRFLSEEEMSAVIESAEDPLSRALVEVLYATGCRIGEAVGCDLEDLSLETRIGRCSGKGDERIVLLNTPAVKAIQDYLPFRARRIGGITSERALFINRHGRRMRVTSAWEILRRLGAKAGLTRRLTPQMIRHSFATHLLNRGADLAVIQKLMGHKRICVTARYAKLMPSRLWQVYRRTKPRR